MYLQILDMLQYSYIANANFLLCKNQSRENLYSILRVNFYYTKTRPEVNICYYSPICISINKTVKYVILNDAKNISHPIWNYHIAAF